MCGNASDYISVLGNMVEKLSHRTARTSLSKLETKFVQILYLCTSNSHLFRNGLCDSVQHSGIRGTVLFSI